MTASVLVGQHRFRVHDLRRRVDPVERDDLGVYLSRAIDRVHNAMNAEVRAYTCRSWRAGVTGPYELHWNAEDVPGETLLGEWGWSIERDLVTRVEREFDRGEAVRLFIFNSDADLCFEEVLEPVHAA